MMIMMMMMKMTKNLNCRPVALQPVIRDLLMWERKITYLL